jgi:hypothetical protein
MYRRVHVDVHSLISVALVLMDNICMTIQFLTLPFVQMRLREHVLSLLLLLILDRVNRSSTEE